MNNEQYKILKKHSDPNKPCIFIDDEGYHVYALIPINELEDLLEHEVIFIDKNLAFVKFKETFLYLIKTIGYGYNVSFNYTDVNHRYTIAFPDETNNFDYLKVLTKLILKSIKRF